METTRLDMALVFPSDNGRPVVGAQVERLAESLSVLGLRQPITVRACLRFIGGQQTDAFEIVAGRHRYEAAVKLKWEEIDGIVMDGSVEDAELWEIDENFARAELTEAQKADHHHRRRRILLDKGLVSDKRGPKLSSPGKVYSEEAADALGVSRQMVDKHVWRGNKIAPDVLAEVSGSDLDNGRVLDELARTPADEQRAKLAEITLRRQEAERVRKDAEKVNKDTDRVVQMTDAERFAEWLLARTDLTELPTILSWLDGTKPKDVSAALRRLAH